MNHCEWHDFISSERHWVHSLEHVSFFIYYYFFASNQLENVVIHLRTGWFGSGLRSNFFNIFLKNGEILWGDIKDAGKVGHHCCALLPPKNWQAQAEIVHFLVHLKPALLDLAKFVISKNFERKSFAWGSTWSLLNRCARAELFVESVYDQNFSVEYFAYGCSIPIY